MKRVTYKVSLKFTTIEAKCLSHCNQGVVERNAYRFQPFNCQIGWFLMSSCAIVLIQNDVAIWRQILKKTIINVTRNSQNTSIIHLKFTYYFKKLTGPIIFNKQNNFTKLEAGTRLRSGKTNRLKMVLWKQKSQNSLLGGWVGLSSSENDMNETFGSAWI